MSDKKRDFIQKLLNIADIKINGEHPWDIQVHNQNLYSRVLKDGSLGLGESYVESWWDVQDLEEFFFRILKADLDEKVKGNLSYLIFILGNSIFNKQTKNRSFIVGQKHYDIGNDLYQAMLDPRLVYTGAYWRQATDLASAQEAKLDLVCRKLNLQAGQHILDIGGGWGSFAKYAAEKYGVKVSVVTVSKKQVELGQKLSKGLPIEFILDDYRNIKGKYDHLVSLGMIEHVGYKNYRQYFQIANKHLKDQGLFLLQSIGSSESVKNTDPWIEKYIFPNSMLPSIKQLGSAWEKLFVMEDWQNFSMDYHKTLLAWVANFKKHWPELKSKYGDSFYRLWRYYLLSAAASFRTRKNQLWQIVLSKKGLPEGYQRVC